jgi:hypothetical protein
MACWTLVTFGHLPPLVEIVVLVDGLLDFDHFWSFFDTFGHFDHFWSFLVTYRRWWESWCLWMACWTLVTFGHLPPLVEIVVLVDGLLDFDHFWSFFDTFGHFDHFWSFLVTYRRWWESSCLCMACWTLVTFGHFCHFWSFLVTYRRSWESWCLWMACWTLNQPKSLVPVASNAASNMAAACLVDAKGASLSTLSTLAMTIV